MCDGTSSLRRILASVGVFYVAFLMAGCSQSKVAAAGNLARVTLAGGSTQLLEYRDVGGSAIFEGDIVLGRTEDFVKAYTAFQQNDKSNRQSIVINGAEFRWPAFSVPYTVDANIANRRADIDKAISVWNGLIRPRLGRDAWIPRTSEPNFVTFRDSPSDDSCISDVGRQGGQQFISLPAGCGPGQIMHEMGHAMGLWHEQSRVDRDRYIRINYANIAPKYRSNFNQHIDDGGKIAGFYDYDSIMHYGAYDFATDPNIPTIYSPRPIGQRSAPSAWDVEGVWVNHEGAGWGVRVCDGTEAQAINFWAGYFVNNATVERFWFRWVVGDRRDWEFQPSLLFKDRIWIKAEGDPHAQVNLCIVYAGDPKQGMTFGKDEEKPVGQNEHTNGCRCQ
jgi:hypothetical protein